MRCDLTAQSVHARATDQECSGVGDPISVDIFGSRCREAHLPCAPQSNDTWDEQALSSRMRSAYPFLTSPHRNQIPPFCILMGLSAILVRNEAMTFAPPRP